MSVPAGKNPTDGPLGDYGVPNPGPAFKEVWQVKVWPKGLGQAKNLVGIYRLCLTEKTVNFVKLNSDAAAVVLQLMNVRRCGHSENFFFVEVGRSAVTGPGEFWMQVSREPAFPTPLKYTLRLPLAQLPPVRRRSEVNG